MDTHTDDELSALADELRAHEISDAFVYVSYLKAGNAFNPTFDHAAAFTQRLHTLAPDVRLLGWVGVPIQMDDEGQHIDNRLTDETVRALIAEFSGRVVNDMGFDGVHLNAELIYDGDTTYLDTLQGVRTALPAGAILSAAPHALRMTDPVTVIPYPTQSHHWSADYLRRVADEVDQVAIMDYDSGLFFPSDYRAWMAYQVRGAAEALAESDVEVFIGIPTSEEWTPSHNTLAETLPNALYGLQVGLSLSADPGVIDGIAVYPYWETSADEWALIDARE
jgi:hypothetical protein